MEPIVSFIVPVYNVSSYIRLCIESLINQTASEYEVLLVDDESTDGSGEICDIYANNYDNIRVFHQKNQGASVARNKGLELAGGEWICFVDADDWIEPQLVETISQYKNQMYDIIYFGYRHNRQKKKKEYLNKVLSQQQLDEKDFWFLQLAILNQGDPRVKKYYGIEGTPWGKVYSRYFLLQNNLWFTNGVKKGQDGLFNMLVYQKANAGCYCDKLLYNYRINEGSVCRRYNPQIEEISDNLLSHYKNLLNTSGDPDLLKAFSYFAIRQFMYCILLDFCHFDNKNKFKERKQRYYIVRKIYKHHIKHAELKKMSKNECLFLVLIRYFPFWMLDFIVKMFR